MKKQNIVIIAVIALVLVLAVGYALFSETLTINGTATASANFDVEFTSIGSVTSAGYTKQTTDPVHEIAAISNDKNAVVIQVNKLDYPGAYVDIPITITNVGTLQATLNAINITGWKSTSTPIKVSYTYAGTTITDTDNAAALASVAVADREIAPQGTKVITVHVEWDANDNTTTQLPETPAQFANDGNTVNGTSQFTISLDYVQSATQAN